MITLDTKIKDIIKDPNLASIVEEYIPGFQNYKEYKLIKSFKARFLIGKGHLVGLSPDKENELMDKLLNYYTE